MRVLVYDSSLQIRDSFISILITAGYEVVAVKDKNNILNMSENFLFPVAIIRLKKMTLKWRLYLKKFI